MCLEEKSQNQHLKLCFIFITGIFLSRRLISTGQHSGPLGTCGIFQLSIPIERLQEERKKTTQNDWQSPVGLFFWSGHSCCCWRWPAVRGYSEPGSRLVIYYVWFAELEASGEVQHVFGWFSGFLWTTSALFENQKQPGLVPGPPPPPPLCPLLPLYSPVQSGSDGKWRNSGENALLWGQREEEGVQNICCPNQTL